MTVQALRRRPFSSPLLVRLNGQGAEYVSDLDSAIPDLLEPCAAMHSVTLSRLDCLSQNDGT